METFLRDLLVDGRISLSEAPSRGNDASARRVLRQAYDVYALSIAGEVLPFDEATALAAGRLVLHAAWYFLHPGLAIDMPDKVLAMPDAPTAPEQHVSADLVLRFLPTLYRRARAARHDDELSVALERVLRVWPLSGVLADIVEPPLTPIDFGAHAGLHFLYAERLARQERTAWFPTGIGMQYVELVWRQLGKDVSTLPSHAPATP